VADAVTIELPAGLTRRPGTWSDVEAIAELIEACETHDLGEADLDRDDVEMAFGRSGFVPERDGLLVLDGETTVGWAEIHRNRSQAYVRPSHRGRGLGTALLAWTERLAGEHGASTILQSVPDANAGAAALLTAAGYRPTRTAWILSIAFDDAPPPEAEPPAGIAIRPYEPSRDEQTVYRLIDDAFSEWDGRDPMPLEEWAPYVIRHHSFSPRMSPLAFDGDDLVGAVMSFDYAARDEGWIQQLATKATHRHRGIARALLHTAFRWFYADGKHRCSLSTDSRTGALTLYERVGMSVRASYTGFGKTL
jgi:GNAT superfamily N-acetyltransferase